jgi:adenosylmethionine-8-amino-7-oxononanoate aminotransferase
MGSIGEHITIDPTVNSSLRDSLKTSIDSDVPKSAVLHRSLHHSPLYAVAAKGNYLFLNNGQEIFDATGGAAVACLGSGNERYVNV